MILIFNVVYVQIFKISNCSMGTCIKLEYELQYIDIINNMK